ncbi:hypothetical protein WME90_45775 [Sorangium sp. So ce375]
MDGAKAQARPRQDGEAACAAGGLTGAASVSETASAEPRRAAEPL